MYLIKRTPFTFWFLNTVMASLSSSCVTEAAATTTDMGSPRTRSSSRSSSTSSKTSTFNIVCYGDSLTEGYYNFGRSLEPYSNSLAIKLNSYTYNSGGEVENVGEGVGGAEEVITPATTTAEGGGVSVGENTQAWTIECEPVGFSGYTTSQLLKKMKQHEEAFLEGADLVLIMAGTNDIGSNRNIFDTIENLENIHQLAWERKIPTVAMTIPESRFTVKETEFGYRRLALNQAIQEEIAEKNPFPLCHFIDISDLNPFNDEKDKEEGVHLWDKDGLHMTAAGYTKFGEKLAPLLKPIIDKIIAVRSSTHHHRHHED